MRGTQYTVRCMSDSICLWTKWFKFFLFPIWKACKTHKKLVETSLSVQCKLDTGLRGDVEWQLRNTLGEKIFTW